MNDNNAVFGTDGIRGRTGGKVINPESILKLGWAVGKALCQQPGNKILIGKDTRISGYMLESALEAGLSAAGMNIQLVGPLPTPGIAYLTKTLRASAGIVITASHNPYWDNGLKFFASNGGKLTEDDEKRVISQLSQPLTMVDSALLGKAERIDDARGRYAEFCKQSFPDDLSLSGMTIVVDCANGATYQVAPSVFAELGARVITLGGAPNGLNINLECGSTQPKALQQAVLKHQADVGIAFDGDGDRLIMVDHRGDLVNGDSCLYVMATHALKMDEAPVGVVGTQMSNEGLVRTLAEKDIGFYRAEVGDKYVLSALQSRGWQMGGEPSGHLIHLGKTTTGDGIIAALQVLRAMCESDRSLHELCADLNVFPQVLINIALSSGDLERMQTEAFSQLMKKSQKKLSGRGRVLVRLSGTEPVVRVMAESDDANLTQKVAEGVVEFFQSKYAKQHNKK